MAEYLFDLLVNQVKHGVDPFLIAYKKWKNLFSNTFQQQFTAYAQGAYLFNVPLGPGQTPLEWWRAFIGMVNTGIIVVCQFNIIKASTVLTGYSVFMVVAVTGCCHEALFSHSALNGR